MNIFPIFWGQLYATHIQFIPIGVLCFFLVSKEDAPTVDVVSVGAIGAVDLLSLDPSNDNSYEGRHDLLCPYFDLRCIVKRRRI